jgi:hypothetical protein
MNSLDLGIERNEKIKIKSKSLVMEIRCKIIKLIVVGGSLGDS